MKNNYLKKAGAVALAAVMAVTFAPVASLNAFAAGFNVSAKDDKGKYTLSTGGDITRVTTGGTYVVSDEGISVAIETKDKVTLEIGADKTTVSFTQTCGAVEIKGSYLSKAPQTGVVVPNVTIDNVASAGYIRINGDMILHVTTDGTDVDNLEYRNGTNENKHSFKNVFGSTPVAFKVAGGVNNNENIYYVGQDAIDTEVQQNDANIFAANGAVKATGLKDGKVAGIDTNAAIGTTITATAEEGKSLNKTVTTYNYNFYVDENSNQGKTGKSTWTDTRYSAGASSLYKAFTDDGAKPDACFEGTDGKVTAGTAVLTGAQISTKGLAVKKNVAVTSFTYSRAITLKQDDKDKYEGVVLPYKDNRTIGVDAHKETDDTRLACGAKGMSYFTENPISYTEATDGVAVIDGTKYIIDDQDKNRGELLAVSEDATKSLAILRGTSTDATPENAMNQLSTALGVKVTAPTSSSIVLGHASAITKTGEKIADTNNGYVYGSNHVEGVNTKNVGNIFAVKSPSLSGTVVASYLEVPQVADGSYAVVLDGYTDTTVTKADSLAYFYEQKVSQIADNKAIFVFAAPSIAKSQFNSVLSGATVNGTTYFTQAVGGETLYASKEIKGKFSGANAKVTVLGEISAVKDAKNVWTVNEGYASAGVTAYRMYRKSGEHVYTINPDEVSMLVNAGWINEGPAFTVNSVASKTGTPIYRLYNRNGGGMHFYTANAAEKDMLLANGWTEGKVVFYGADKATGIPVYRTYNTGSNNGEHNYTTNIKESDMNVKAGWRAEGVAFYVFK
jgi:hypothetical protein